MDFGVEHNRIPDGVVGQVAVEWGRPAIGLAGIDGSVANAWMPQGGLDVIVVVEAVAVGRIAAVN